MLFKNVHHVERIAILASGSGSNAVNILSYFNNSSVAEIAGVFSNKMTAPVLEKFLDRDVNSYYFENNLELVELLDEEKVTFIVLAGYLKLIPKELTAKYHNRIINIHPALLPNYGGKGMYGMNVHKAVKQNAEKVSGISIHYVNEIYDEGEVIFQAETQLDPGDSVKVIARKVQELEHEHYPVIIEKVIKNDI